MDTYTWCEKSHNGSNMSTYIKKACTRNAYLLNILAYSIAMIPAPTMVMDLGRNETVVCVCSCANLNLRMCVLFCICMYDAYAFMLLCIYCCSAVCVCVCMYVWYVWYVWYVCMYVWLCNNLLSLSLCVYIYIYVCMHNVRNQPTDRQTQAHTQQRCCMVLAAARKHCRPCVSLLLRAFKHKQYACYGFQTQVKTCLWTGPFVW